MRSFTYTDPDEGGNPIVTHMTEQEILQSYFPWWSERMRTLGRENQISKENCINDWIADMWAEEVPQ